MSAEPIPNVRPLKTQLDLPGIEVHSIVWKEFLEKNPEPKTVLEAEYFFRKNTRAIITMGADHDTLRVTLKTRNMEEDEVKYEISVELPYDDEAYRNKRFLETAQEVYRQWIKLESSKH